MQDSEAKGMAINKALKNKLDQAKKKLDEITGDNYPLLRDFKVGVEYHEAPDGSIVLDSRGYEKLYHRIFP